MPFIDIVLPVYNPIPDWEDTVIQRFRSLASRFPDIVFSLTIVNDGSPGLNDSAAAKILQASLPEMNWVSYEENMGKGYALRKGIESTRGDYIVFTDIDWPYTEDSMARIITSLQQGADVAIGVRDQAYYAHLPVWRRRISKWLRKINSRVLHLKSDDTQAGLKGFKNSLKPIFLSTTINRYLFDLEFIYLISKQHVSLVSIPIELREGIQFSTMNRKILFQEGFNFFKIWLR